MIGQTIIIIITSSLLLMVKYDKRWLDNQQSKDDCCIFNQL